MTLVMEKNFFPKLYYNETINLLMKTTETGNTKEFCLIYFFLTTSLCFFSLSALLIVTGNAVPNTFLWVAFIALLSGLFRGAEKIISWERNIGKIINDFSLYIMN
jgi:hypothetical protein